MALEEAGVATVSVHTHVFERLSRASALAYGMPTVRQTFIPQPLVDQTVETIQGYIRGTDPTTARPFMQEVLEGLSSPLNDNDLKGLSFERETPRLLDPDSEDNLQNLFVENQWSDFLPVTLPTEARVEAMLKGTSHSPDEVVGRLRPASFREFWEFDVEKVAVNAVMAGARPEYLPVILALAASGQTARSSSTTSFATIGVVNGPIRNEIGMNSGIGAMGPFNHANATIGRAYNLLSQNLQGGSVPGETYMGSVGNWLNFSATLAENEERSPWAPLHTQHGFKADESAVSVFFGGRYMISGFGPREHWKEQFRRGFTACENYLAPMLLMDPIAARGFVDLGFDTKEKLIDWCSENARLPAAEFWDDIWATTLGKPLGVAGVEPHASRLKAAPDEEISMFEPDDISIVVTGGETQAAWKLLAGRRVKNGTISVDKWR